MPGIRIIAIFAVFLSFGFASHMALASKASVLKVDPHDMSAEESFVALTLGKGRMVNIKGAVSDVMVADPSLIKVTAIQSGRLYIVGSRVGDTNIIVLDSAGDVIKSLDVHVRVDIVAIQRTLKDLFPDEDVKVTTVNDQIILRGDVSTPAVASRIRDVVARFASDAGGAGAASPTGDAAGSSGLASSAAQNTIINMMNVQGEQQVMLRVRILELARTALKELGLETQVNPGGSLSADGSGGLINVNNQTGLSQAPFASGQLILDTGISGLTPFNFLLNALEDRDLVKTLAEPNLTAISGQEAGFLAGGQFPLPSIPDNDLQASTNIRLQPFGVALDFVPTVLSSKRISLQLSTEVSSISPENSISIGSPAINIPGLDIRRANTTVEIASGSTMMIAGLIQSDYIKGLAGLPGVMNTPVIGDLIKSRSFQRNETELVIMVTPYIVKPFSDKNKSRQIPGQNNDPLQVSFEKNMREIYGSKYPLSPKMENVGYVID